MGLLAAALALPLASSASPEVATARLDAANVTVERVPGTIIGVELEGVGHSIVGGGLYSQLIFDESWEDPDDKPPPGGAPPTPPAPAHARHVQLQDPAGGGRSLRHCDALLYSTPDSGPSDHIFALVPALSGAAGAVSFQSTNFPTYYIAPIDGDGPAARGGGSGRLGVVNRAKNSTAAFADSASFVLEPAPPPPTATEPFCAQGNGPGTWYIKTGGDPHAGATAAAPSGWHGPPSDRCCRHKDASGGADCNWLPSRSACEAALPGWRDLCLPCSDLDTELGCPEFDGFEPVAIRSHDGRYVAGSASVPLACGFKAPDAGVALAATKQTWHMVNVSAGPPSVAGPGHHWEYHGAASTR